MHQPGLDPLPLGPAVLEPDLHLHLGQPQGVGDLRALGQREVLFAVELLLQLQQLFTGEGRATSPGFASSSQSIAVSTFLARASTAAVLGAGSGPEEGVGGRALVAGGKAGLDRAFVLTATAAAAVRGPSAVPSCSLVVAVGVAWCVWNKCDL